MSKDRPAGRKFRISIMGIVCLAISLAGGMIPLYADHGVDITFFHVADPHYRAFDTTANGSNKVIRANVERMEEIPGATLPDGLGTVGQPLGVMPNLLVVGPSNRAAAKTVIEAEKNAAGASNINYKAVDIMVCPWLD